MHSDLIPHGLDKALQLDIQITNWEEEKMEPTPESIEEFRTTKCSLLLGNTELSLLKSEVEADVPLLESKKHGKCTLDNPGILDVPAKKKKGESGGRAPVHHTSTKRRATLADPTTLTAPAKKVKGL